LDYAFGNLVLYRIVAIADKENTPSVALLDRLGEPALRTSENAPSTQSLRIGQEEQGPKPLNGRDYLSAPEVDR
jgi:hypothetical protein